MEVRHSMGVMDADASECLSELESVHKSIFRNILYREHTSARAHVLLFTPSEARDQMIDQINN